MPQMAMLFGGLQIALGIIVYLATGSKSVTALIPSFLGILLVISGVIALKPNLRKHAMHGAAMLGLLGTLLPLGRAIPALARGKANISDLSIISMLLMAALSLIFLVLCVRSFIAARRARTTVATDFV